MSNPRFYCEAIAAGELELSGPEGHHLADVLRISPGASVELFDGAGTVAEAVVLTTCKAAATLCIRQIQKIPPRTAGRIIIAAAVAKQDRFEWLIEKCTELATDTIYPVVFERSVKQPRPAPAMRRYRLKTIAAAKQSGRLLLPTIREPLPLPAFIQNLKTEYPEAVLTYGSIDEGAIPATEISIGAADIAAIVGPEGGLTESEQDLLADAAARPVRLSNTTLRVETAAIAFAAILATKRDNQQPPRSHT